MRNKVFRSVHSACLSDAPQYVTGLRSGLDDTLPKEEREDQQVTKEPRHLASLLVKSTTLKHVSFRISIQRHGALFFTRS
jgi:hypothetical protein